MGKQREEVYLKRIKGCFTAVKILVGISVFTLSALIVFAIVAAVNDLKTVNPNGFLLWVIILAGVTALCFIAALTALLVAAVNLKKLQKTGKREGD